MKTDTRQAVMDGTISGVLAGIPLILTQTLAGGLMFSLPFMPARMIAGVVIGRTAVEPTTPVLGIALLGFIIHLVFSGLFGAAYGILNVVFSTRTTTSFGRELALGVIFGAALDLFNIELVARFLFPWFLSSPPAIQLLLHAFCFGAPLGLLYASAGRASLRERNA